MLGRDPDALGLSLYTQLVTNGTSLGVIQDILAYSQESTNHLTTLVADVTGLAPTAGQIAGYETQLASGTPLVTVEAPLVAQAQGDIAGLYQQELGRAADSGGLALYQSLVPTLAIENQMPVATIRAILAYSPEETNDLTALYTNVYGQAPTSAQINALESQIAGGASQQTAEAPILAALTAEIAALYPVVLGRVADAGGVSGFASAVEGGLPFSSVRGLIAGSTEAANDINALYQQVLGRASDTGGFNAFESDLATTLSLAGVRAFMAVSTEASNDLTAAYQSAYGGAAPSGNALTFLEAELALVTGPSAAGTSLAAVEASLANPLIIDTVGGQTITTPSTDQPFAAASVSDPTTGTETATITLLNAQNAATDANGALAGAGLTETAAGSGVYTLTSANAAALSAALENLVFTPTTSNQAVTTTVRLAVTDGAGHAGTDATTTITTQTLGTPSRPNFVYSSVGADAFAGTAGAGPTTPADIFAFNAGSAVGNDAVTGFNLAKDMVQFSQAQFATPTAVLAATSNNGVGSAVIHVDGQDSVTLNGISTASLSAQNIRIV